MKIVNLIACALPLCASFGGAALHPSEAHEAHHSPSIEVTSIEVAELAESSVANTATTAEMAAGLHEDGVIEFANPNEHYWSCVDGRSLEPIFGTPGGDAGEFVAAFSALYPFASDAIKAKPIGALTAELFEKYLETEITEDRPFYLHSDEASVNKVREQLACDEESCAIFFPDPDDEDRLAELQSSPEYMGCGHLKLMLLHPEQYGVNPIVVISLIQSFFRHAFAQPDSAKTKIHIHSHEEENPFGPQLNEQSGKTLFVDLPGEHVEQVVLTVNGEENSSEGCTAPMVRPYFIDPEANEYTQYFVSHSLSSTITGLREKNSAFFYREFEISDPDPTFRQYETVTEFANAQLMDTVGYLAAGLPIMAADVGTEGFSGDRC